MAPAGPSPFELDRARKAGTQPPEPQSSGANALAPEAEAPVSLVSATVGDARERLHAYLHEKGHAHLADAVENASIAMVGGDLNVVAPKSYARYFKDPGFDDAVREIFGRPLRLKLTTPETAAGPPPVRMAAPLKTETGDEVTGRALANPEVAGDVEMLQDMVLAACGEAVKQVEAQIQQKMGGMLGGMGLPPGLF